MNHELNPVEPAPVFPYPGVEGDAVTAEQIAASGTAHGSKKPHFGERCA